MKSRVALFLVLGVSCEFLYSQKKCLAWAQRALGELGFVGGEVLPDQGCEMDELGHLRHDKRPSFLDELAHLEASIVTAQEMLLNAKSEFGHDFAERALAFAQSRREALLEHRGFLKYLDSGRIEGLAPDSHSQEELLEDGGFSQFLDDGVL
jgi:hypothetical protein